MENPLLKKIVSVSAASGYVMEWRDYTRLCLFDEEYGYYAKEKLRVGTEGADFYTSSSLKQRIFGELFSDALTSILSSAGKNISDFEIVEIGAEADRKIIDNSRVVKLGQEITIPKRACVISNELLDAQPFSRFKFIGGKWRKSFVKFSKSGDSIAEEFGETDDFENEILEKYFKRANVENFRVDFSFDAQKMLKNICAQNWKGAFVFADYFRDSQEICILPNGTARTYCKHVQGANFFDNIGDTDITFAPCSDAVIDVLKEAGFADIKLCTQEEFFVKNSANKIRQIIESTDSVNPRKRELCQLLSPAHMGACFRIISATRA